MTEKFTPGPWAAVHDGDDRVFARADDPQARELVARVYSGGWNFSSDVTEEVTHANGALIAAAPELYAALLSASEALQVVALEAEKIEASCEWEARGVRTTAETIREIAMAAHKSSDEILAKARGEK